MIAMTIMRRITVTMMLTRSTFSQLPSSTSFIMMMMIIAKYGDDDFVENYDNEDIVLKIDDDDDNCKILWWCFWHFHTQGLSWWWCCWSYSWMILETWQSKCVGDVDDNIHLTIAKPVQGCFSLHGHNLKPKHLTLTIAYSQHYLHSRAAQSIFHSEVGHNTLTAWKNPFRVYWITRLTIYIWKRKKLCSFKSLGALWALETLDFVLRFFSPHAVWPLTAPDKQVR